MVTNTLVEPKPFSLMSHLKICPQVLYGHRCVAKNVKSTLIVFTASWADNCYFTHPMWVRFSNRFTTDKVRILEVDCTGGAAFNKLVKAFKINT